MRKKLEIAGLAALAILIFITIRALFGPAQLSQQIPTHFGSDGQPDAWSGRWSLLALPIVAVALYILMTVVARYPSAFNFPVRVTAVNRRRLESLALDMIAWLKVEVVCVLAWIEHLTINAARSGQGSISPFFMPIVLGCIFATVIWHVIVMRRTGRPASASQRGL